MTYHNIILTSYNKPLMRVKWHKIDLINVIFFLKRIVDIHYFNFFHFSFLTYFTKISKSVDLHILYKYLITLLTFNFLFFNKIYFQQINLTYFIFKFLYTRWWINFTSKSFNIYVSLFQQIFNKREWQFIFIFLTERCDLTE